METAKSIASNLAMLSPFALGLGFGGKSKPATRDATPNTSRPATPQPPPTTPGMDKVGSTVVDASAGSTASQAASASTSKSWWSLPSLPIQAPSTSAMYGLGALALGAAAAGTAYYRREDFATGWKWGFDHMTFVRNLWDDEAMRARLDNIDQLRREHNVLFSNFYTHLPPTLSFPTARTFSILPPRTHPTSPYWVAATNTRAADETGAHMYMFNARTNDGFYELGLAVVRAIGERIEAGGVRRDEGVDVRRLSESMEGVSVSDGWKEEEKDGKKVWVEE